MASVRPRRYPSEDLIHRRDFNLADFTARKRKETGKAWFEGDALKTYPKAFGIHRKIEHPEFIGKTGTTGKQDLHWYADRRLQKGNIHQRAKKP